MACDSPIYVNSKGVSIPVPCGKCPPCKMRRVNEWVFRMMWEEQHNSVSSYFVTLTYDTAHVPLTPHGFMTLRKKDFQDFMKRLRKSISEYRFTGLDHPPVKYYACGEYGTKTNRPHYHAIILNVPNPDLFASAWSLSGVQFGAVDIGTATSDSVAYCMKYIDKESFREKKYRHSRDDREREFSLMSKGIGAGYVEDDAVRRYHSADLSRNFLTKLSGHRIAMPRYYRQKIFTEQQLEQQRAIIESAVYEHEQKRRHLHDASGTPYTFPERLEFEREGRRKKFKAQQDKRSKL